MGINKEKNQDPIKKETEFLKEELPVKQNFPLGKTIRQKHDQQNPFRIKKNNPSKKLTQPNKGFP